MDTKSINDNIDFQTTFSNVSKKNHIFNSKNIKTSNDNIYDSTNNHFKTITQKRAVSDEEYNRINEKNGLSTSDTKTDAYCRFCGAKLTGPGKFCANCGSKV